MQHKTNLSTDEITLFDLFVILWKGKLAIFVFVCIGIALAAAYAFTAKQEWVSRAQVIPPKAVQLGTYLEAQRGYYRFAVIENDLKIEDSLNKAYKTLIVMLSAADEKHEYLLGSGYYQKKITELNDELARKTLLQTMLEKDLLVDQTFKDRDDSHEISFSAETASDAQITLQGYIENVNKKVLNKLFGDLHAQIQERIITLTYEAESIKNQTEQTRKNNMLALKKAIAAAKDADITEYTGQSTAMGNTIIDFSRSENMFLLGEKYLSAQLNALETSPVIYPVNYYQTLENIKGLEQLMDYEVKGVAYEYTMAPSLPLSKDKPKKAVILFLGALFGGLIGGVYIMICGVFGNKKYLSKNNNNYLSE